MTPRVSAFLRFRARALAVFAAVVAAGGAQAAELPQIKVSATNKVPACVTPGRLAAYLEARNPSLDPRFQNIAVDYMRHGEDLKIRWDYAFFQMLVETGNLTFKRLVKPRQNNFAGLGATGPGEPGETFPDVTSGVRAHLQHVLMYSGETVENPVAERTRKVQEWGVLTSWQKGFSRPITFRDLAGKWAPTDRSYPASIEAVATRFFSDFCNEADPKPDLVAEARRGRATDVAAVDPKAAPAAAAAPKRAAETAPATPVVTPPSSPPAAPPQASAKAAPPSAPAQQSPVPQTAATSSPPVRVLNKIEEPASPPLAAQAPAVSKAEAPKSDTAKADPPSAKAGPPAKIETASAAAATGAAKAGSTALIKPSEPGKCRVWTASYGGQKAIIIRAPAGPLTHFTVLEVNEGAEKKEADAYIAVYARGGQMIGEFPSQAQALDKAFDLCPEG